MYVIDTHMICVLIQSILLQLCGLAILVVGVLVQVGNKHYSKHLEEITNNITFPSITLIVLGSIIFVIAFLGCCGAIRESHCMMVTVSSPAKFHPVAQLDGNLILSILKLVFTYIEYFNFNPEHGNSSLLYIPNVSDLWN